MKSFIIFAVLLLSGLEVFANSTSDIGVISRVFSTPSGGFGFNLVGGRAGIPNAVKEFPCTTGGGWVGVEDTSPSFISSILAAKMAGKSIQVYISKCNGGWFEPSSIYILD